MGRRLRRKRFGKRKEGEGFDCGLILELVSLEQSDMGAFSSLAGRGWIVGDTLQYM